MVSVSFFHNCRTRGRPSPRRIVQAEEQLIRGVSPKEFGVFLFSHAGQHIHC